MNEEIQIITTYNPFVITGVILSIIWAGAYILSWLVQWSWAWVDETKASKYNWVVQRFKYKTDPLPENGWAYVDEYYKYHLYKDGERVDRADSLASTCDNVSMCVTGNYSKYPFFLPLIWLSVLFLNFWSISMWFAMAFGLAFIMRMARRGQKLLTSHINDKNAHKEGK